MPPSLHIQPPLMDFDALVQQRPDGELFGYEQSIWREKTRHELGLATDCPVIATGHQTLLWHPGILAKYLALEAAAANGGFATANLVVDQHVDRFGAFDVPLRRSDGTLTTRTIELTPAQPEVPMGLQKPFDPPDPLRHWPFAHESVAGGVERIIAAVRKHRAQPNAALQMAAVLAELMSRWTSPIPNVTATDLGETTLAREMLARMAENPHEMAEHYNRAVAAVPEAGIPPLLVRDDYVEVPLWRIRPDGRRMRAYDNDVQELLESTNYFPLPSREGVRGCGAPVSDRKVSDQPPASPTPQPPPSREGGMRLLPRALFMTALVRLGMCDLFIHGTGGANYDRAMELWIRNWLGVEVAPIAVVTATLTLPLDDDALPDVDAVVHTARRAWHDPESLDDDRSPGDRKRAALARISKLPRGSIERRAAFFEMHKQLAEDRQSRREMIDLLSRRAELARRRAEGRAIAERRDWPFALYPQSMIDDLAAAMRGAAREQGASQF